MMVLFRFERKSGALPIFFEMREVSFDKERMEAFLTRSNKILEKLGGMG
jgi:hypothetical protein